MKDILKDRANVIIPPPILYGGFLIGGLFLNFIWPLDFFPVTMASVLAITLFVVAGVISFYARREMKRLKTSINPSRPTTALAKNGPFRFSRNPLYLALTLVYLGFAALFNSLWLIIFVLPLMVIMQRGVIAREESYLEKKFGDEYRNYKSRVRRWF